MIKTIKAKSQIKKTKDDKNYYFGVLFTDDENKWYNVFDNNLESIKIAYNDFEKGINIDVDLDGNIIMDYRLVNEVKEEVVKDKSEGIKEFKKDWDKINEEKNKRIWKAQSLNLAFEMFFSIIFYKENYETIENLNEDKKEQNIIKDIFDLTFSFYSFYHFFHLPFPNH